jgi:peptidoglycan/LPS O-acetylase OafA/YrhL
VAVTSDGRVRKLGSFLSERGAAENGFDTLRLIAAWLVLVSHAFALTSGDVTTEPLYDFSNGQLKLGYLSVGCFFSLSGLLITQSFQRSSSLQSYVRKRAARILPGLWVSLLVTVLALAFVTTVPLQDYFLSVQTAKFLAGNGIIIMPVFELPGVFETLPYERAVNGSLWTLRHEILCYVLVVICGLAGARFGLATAALTLLSFAIVSFAIPVPDTIAVWAGLFRFYGLGMLCYQYRNLVPVSGGLTVVSGVALIGLMPTPAATHLLPIFITYFVVGVGLLAPKWFIAPTARGDISYGVYIYAFPVQQLLVPLCQASAAPALMNIVLATPIVVALATLSWVFVERPARDWNQRLKLGRKRAALT